jgi:hypothetical protein
MGSGQIAPIPQTGGGLSSVQDLYDLINGKTTTTSGGTTTATTSEGISSDSMNAMLQNILSGTNGLAAISSGQRAAGGYGSSVNTMLTNDLLTKAAAQVAMTQKNSTTTTTKPEVTSTVGGATAGGTAKTAGFLEALKSLSDSGATGWLKKNLNLGKTDTPVAAPPTAIAGTNVATGTTQVSAPSVNASPDTSGVMDYSGGITAPVQGVENSYIPTSSPIPDVGTGVDVGSIPDTTGTMDYSGGLPDDLLLFADGGYVSQGKKGTGGGNHPIVATLGSKMNPVRLADGGSVSKKVLGVLGANQYNSVIDPRESLAGDLGVGFNADGTPVNPVTTVDNPVQPSSKPETSPINPVPNVYPETVGSTLGMSLENVLNSQTANQVSAQKGTDPLDEFLNLNNSFGTGTQTPIQNPADSVVQSGTPDLPVSPDNVNDVSAGAPASPLGDLANSLGDVTRPDVQNVSSGLSILGNLTGNSTLAGIGAAGVIASKPTFEDAGITAANILTKGAVGKVLGANDVIQDPSIENVTNLVANVNPLGALANGLLGMADMPSLGTTTSNIVSAINPDSPVTFGNIVDGTATAVRTQQTDLKANAAPDPTSADVAAAMVPANSPDPIGALINNLGAVDAGPPPVVAPPVVTPAPAAAPAPDISEGALPSSGSYSSGSSGGYTSAAGADSGSSGAFSGGFGGGGGGDADGGLKEGPGSSISDSIHTMLSDGEYVLSADTVKAIGIAKLDALQAKYHTPAAVQKLRSHGKRR